MNRRSFLGWFASSVTALSLWPLVGPDRLIRVRVVNVKDFGALGDGKHNDTHAIETAMDYLGEEGGTLFFPKGTYRYHYKRGAAQKFPKIKFIGQG